jgi:hypothetical protein
MRNRTRLFVIFLSGNPNEQVNASMFVVLVNKQVSYTLAH